MIAVEPGEFNGMACRWLGNGQVRLAVTVDRGPRVAFWGLDGGRNLFAELPGMVEQTPVGPFRFVGGHRLWHAPEAFHRTYWPDDWQVEVEEVDGGARFVTPADGTGIVKELRIELVADQSRVRVTHTLRNFGLWPVELAPWALSMCRLGGVVLLPQPRALADPHGLLPNRHFVFWPYGGPTDERLHLGNRIALIHARPAPKNKLGYRNHHGWVAYWLDGTLFSKRFDPRLEADHPDFGCNAESYLDERFVEVETLGPLTRLAPGAAASHVELWELHPDVPPVTTEDHAVTVAQALGFEV
jgi:hypothetical protein